MLTIRYRPMQSEIIDRLVLLASDSVSQQYLWSTNIQWVTLATINYHDVMMSHL